MKCIEKCEFIDELTPTTFWCSLYDKVLISVVRKDGSNCLIRCKKCEKQDINSIKMFLSEIDVKCKEIMKMKTKISEIMDNINYD